MKRCKGFVQVSALLFILVLVGCASSPHGRYEDSEHNYIDFHRAGKAYTNIAAGGSEMQITYEVEEDRVILHELDGNPTLRFNADESLCCGPAGLLIPKGLR